MKINVTWCNFKEQTADTELLTVEPVPVFKFYQEMANAAYRRCPAHQNHFKNTYVVCSPIDIEIVINKEENWCDVVYPKNSPKDIFSPRFKEEGDSPYPLFSLRLGRFVFTTNAPKDVYMTLLDPSLEWDKDRNIRVIEGGFNISKWTRPLEASFEQKTKNITIKFKRGQPMYYVRFSTDDPEDTVVLNRVEMDDATDADIKRCLDVKTFLPNRKLQFLYDLRDRYISSLKK
jgi:hypothetical protein